MTDGGANDAAGAGAKGEAKRPRRLQQTAGQDITLRSGMGGPNWALFWRLHAILGPASVSDRFYLLSFPLSLYTFLTCLAVSSLSFSKPKSNTYFASSLSV
jgi:hypothetical protein